MRDTLPFLQRLGLDQDSDARAIRRAYARALKLIDQEQDSAGFQQLREAYDAALQWAAWHTQQPVTAPEPQATAPNYSLAHTPGTLDAAAAAPVTADAPSAAAAVFGEFQAAMAQLLQQQRTQNTAEWQRALQHSLNDERLLDFDARFAFETQIAQLLVSGWQPGHDTLFTAAGKVFQWEDERRSLQQLGRSGMLIDRAISEHAVYQTLSESERMIHHAALALLRKDSQPSAYQLRGDMPYVERLMQLFPTWMPMVVDLARVAQWRASYRALPAEKKSWWPTWRFNLSPHMGWVLVLILFQVMRVALQDNDEPGSYTGSFTQPAPQVTPEYPPLPEYLRQNISDRIHALPLSSFGPGEHQAEFTITLDEQGKLYQMMLYHSSGSRSYDEAVMQALRASQPFAPETPRKFQVIFTAPTGSAQ